MFEPFISNLSKNISFVVNGLSQGQSIPITISQSTDPWQFWINAGIALVSGGTILALPMLLSGSNPIRKAKNIKEFNRITGRPTLVIDHGKSSLFSPKMIDNKTATTIIRAMNRLNGRDFNLVLNSNGGEVFSSQLISDAMMKYPGKIEVYVPKKAMSGATLLSLSTNGGLHMTEYSSLGMLDAQIGNLISQGSAAGWEEVVQRKGPRANDTSIICNRLGKQVTQSLKQNIRDAIKNKTPKVEEVVEFLTSGDKEHIYQVKRDKLIELGFTNICEITPRENKLLVEMVD